MNPFFRLILFFATVSLGQAKDGSFLLHTPRPSTHPQLVEYFAFRVPVPNDMFIGRRLQLDADFQIIAAGSLRDSKILDFPTVAQLIERTNEPRNISIFYEPFNNFPLLMTMNGFLYNPWSTLYLFR